MKNDMIKWGFIQPLIGGAYFGAEAAIGCPASWILSFPGFCDHREKDGTICAAGNEFHLMKYLQMKNRLPPYLTIDRQPFAEFKNDPNAFNPNLIRNEFSTTDSIDLTNTDIVCALPVCSGLSNATTTPNNETRVARNQNMQWITEYVLRVIKPKAYIFENAPALFAGTKGKPIREYINKIAEETGYSVSYFKTDTCLHHNAQRRPRTFVICWKWYAGKKQMPPILNFVNDKMSIKDFFAEMPKYEQCEVVPLLYDNKAALEYIKMTHQNDWRETLYNMSAYAHIVQNDEVDAFIAFCETYQFETDKQRAQCISQIKHAKEKYDAGSWIFDTKPRTIDVTGLIPTIMHKNTVAMLHPYEERLLSIGEMLYCMGMPSDFRVYGGWYEKMHHIGQNVPAKTMQYIVSEIVRVIRNWDVERNNTNGNPFFGDDENEEYVDNTKQICSTKVV